MKFYKSLSLFFLKYLYKYRIRQCKISCVNTKRNKSVIVELQHITRKRFIPMTRFTTELLNFLAQKQDIDDIFRSSLETAMNACFKQSYQPFQGMSPMKKQAIILGLVVMERIHGNLKPNIGKSWKVWRIRIIF